MPGIDEARHAPPAAGEAVDAAFFAAHARTRLYCRPTCPTRRSRRAPLRIYRSAAAAETAGFRPCPRCRPELAPRFLDPALPEAVLATVRAVDAGDEDSLPRIAANFSLDERRLRRLFEKHLSVTIGTFAATQRALFAKQLLTDSELPLRPVAAAAGFRNLATLKRELETRYGSEADTLRRRPRSGRALDRVSFDVPYHPPLPWGPLLDYLRLRAFAGVEAANRAGYRRTCRIAGIPGWLSACPVEGAALVRVTVPGVLAGCLLEIRHRVRALFDLDAVPSLIDNKLGTDSDLESRIIARPGLRVPGAFDGFELAVRAVLGQQVSVAGATTLAGRLAARFGEPVETPFEDLRTTPISAERLAAAPLEAIATIGLPRARARTVSALAAAVAAGEIDLEGRAPVAETMERLKALPGIGEWTAQYVALRALRWADAFPEGDLGLQKALVPGTRLSAVELKARAERWRPWRAYAAIRLWSG